MTTGEKCVNPEESERLEAIRSPPAVTGGWGKFFLFLLHLPIFWHLCQALQILSVAF
jgi:hypothetical protein